MPGDIIRFATLRYEIDYKPKGIAPPPLENPFEMSLLEKAGLQKKLESNPNPKWLVTDTDSETNRRIDLESI